MGTKEALLALFENNKGVYISGEEIADRLSVSRTAVWKAVGALRKDGYPIDAVQNKGYCLSVETDLLSEQGIRKYLNPSCSALEIVTLPSVGSTNLWLREKAAAGAPNGYIVVANTQTAGRGRAGRSFFSPPDTGVYMSMLLRPKQCPQNQAIRLTTMAAVAVCEAIEAISGEKAEIKWVNDIYIRGRKVSGILTEASFGLEDGLLEYAILGIGINVSLPKEGFPEPIEQIAGAIFASGQNDGKNRLAAEVLNRFMTYYTMANPCAYYDAYKRRSLILGREIEVIAADTARRATAVALDEECRLVVRYENGQSACLSSGEVRLRI